MPIVPLFGHHKLREHLRDAAAQGTLPSSLLLVGPRGVGKQRLALWLGQLLLCSGDGSRPCGRCQHCRFSGELTHPDLHWFFARPRLKESDFTPQEALQDLAEASADRVAEHGLYPAPGGMEGIFIATVHAIVGSAAISPAMAKRKVFIVGDAERMVPQEGADQAANAFLKLLEEPPADTQLILTTSEPGALLPTIRSRVVMVRVAPLGEADMRAFLADPVVAERLDKEHVGSGAEDRLRLAVGAPGRLFAAAEWSQALANARGIVEAATNRDPAARYRVAFAQGVREARGGFSDTLDALTVVLHERARAAVAAADIAAAAGSAPAVEAVERAKELASGNVNPQLLTASLVRELAGALR